MGSTNVLMNTRKWVSSDPSIVTTHCGLATGRFDVR